MKKVKITQRDAMLSCNLESVQKLNLEIGGLFRCHRQTIRTSHRAHSYILEVPLSAVGRCVKTRKEKPSVSEYHSLRIIAYESVSRILRGWIPLW